MIVLFLKCFALNTSIFANLVERSRRVSLTRGADHELLLRPLPCIETCTLLRSFDFLWLGGYVNVNIIGLGPVWLCKLEVLKAFFSCKIRCVPITFRNGPSLKNCSGVEYIKVVSVL